MSHPKHEENESEEKELLDPNQVAPADAGGPNPPPEKDPPPPNDGN